MSWSGKLLRVNLTNGTCTSEALNMEWAQEYLGQRGLASKYLVEEIDPQVDPLSPENKMIMTTGPLTGTMAATGGRYSVVTKGPLTNCIACSNSGGFIGAEMHNAGWDMIIFEGRSANPVYLYLLNDKAELRSADEIWGKSVWETDEWLHAKHQDPMLRIAAVGRSAEEGCLYAAIVNDLHRAAGRSGVGTVMASKNLKAVAIRGTLGVGNIKDPAKFMQAVSAGKQVLADNAVTGQGLPTYGTQVLMNVINEIGALPTRNMKEVQFEGAQNVSGEAMHENRPTDGKPNLTTNAGCFGCTIACGRISTIDKGHFSVENKPQYWGNSGGLEYEAAWALGPDTGVDDLDALTYVNFICNEDGFDPISFGSTVAAAMELYKIGAISTAETGGHELKFGSAESLVWAVEVLVSGEGFGKDLGLGSKRLCEKYGHPELSMTVKGQEFPAYDPRGIQGMGLAYATSNRGACHLRGYTVASEVLGIPEKTDPLATEGKAGLVKAFQDATAAVDSSGLCLFTTFAWSLEDIAPQVDGACEGEWTAERMAELGERVWNMEREFNLKAGLTAADDTLPKRLLKEAANVGPAQGRVNDLDQMLPEYYELRGWSTDGVPTDETRKRLGLG
ncbi:MAG: aldehyde ferredoxin oxidoreductase family protein [Candidatus Thiodiazotropha lotti]|uniref:Aldehyde ferredoxin oxidoreductase n=1 Tax=Candidatus Thiodiazotropha endoloripes TaxID=1818881 RepID=A0A1E2UKW1_9GAMM|nr:aldehyde ferredoxin oxidoreductase family protein [Candidatus Thiodiazotropha endoloripes]MCG7903313.1 aldehyde ferredoxin oxidoreductase family protein [Candidatus Thiodiazotropha weberae]MCG7992211.1 aldehyde ferredoxin oxidoreductase family protein [Candidatus Thiodiazotropha lotti]MCG7915275.1 aldehyde ferredoxin oxidoreductase family protein [Candidatus Thiodiazotropha weberae]MCG7998716.1 aldehyde ferredoxin oxidoreductase family protein [Candidatus Thiodiazotropha lotti]MCW4183869.1 